MEKAIDHLAPSVSLDERQAVELELLLEGVFRVYGVDFRGYSRYWLQRRVLNLLKDERLPTISELQARVLHDPAAMERLQLSFSVNITTMFRDPGFFKSFRKKVVPYLFAHPFVRIWHAGCSTGEEVYSLAILLHEEGLFKRARIYATDMNAGVLEVAKAGIYEANHVQEFTSNYLKAGGTQAFSDYYTAQYGNAILKSWLREKIVFAPHNLATDSSFNEFNVILCRNVMIYFDKPLQNRVHGLLHQSLRRFGVLALGRGETIRHTPYEPSYEPVDEEYQIYRKTAA